MNIKPSYLMVPVMTLGLTLLIPGANAQQGVKVVPPVTAPMQAGAQSDAASKAAQEALKKKKAMEKAAGNTGKKMDKPSPK